MRPTSTQSRQSGFTILEVMIALTIGLMITGVTATLFANTKRVYNENQTGTALQENGRFALNTLLADLAAVDFFGGMTDPENIVAVDADLTLGGTECGSPAGWTYSSQTSLTYLNQPSASLATTTFPCLTAIEAGTNVLMIKRVRGLSTAAPTTDTVYVRTNRTTGEFIRYDAGDGAPAADESDWEFYVRVYYIEDNMLKRKSLTGGSPPTMQEETLAEGVELFHVQFGIDSDSDRAADYFTSSPSNADLENAVSARIHVLARGDNTVNGYANNNEYNLGDMTVPRSGDGYYRRVFTASTPLRNMMTTRQFSTD